MNLRQLLLQEHSKAQAVLIAGWIGKSQKRFDQLIHLLLTDEYRVAQRAAMPLTYCVDLHPQLIQKHISRIVRLMQQPGIHTAVKRNILRILQTIELPEQIHGELMDACFHYMESMNEPAAVKAFSITILHRLSSIYPEIIPEIKLILEDRWEHETPAFKVRARAFLRVK